MSRERPSAPPRAVPDAERGVKHESQRQRAAREELDRLKAAHGPSFFAGFFNPMGRQKMKAPQFIRRGYLSQIVEDLNDFFRSKCWRPRVRRSVRTHKEHQKILRRLEQQGVIKRAQGRGRFELTKDAPRA